MAIDTFKKLLNILVPWFEKAIPANRLEKNDAPGRVWMLQNLGYDKTLTLADLKEYTDRSNLNSQYVGRYNNKDPKSMKGISALSAEVSKLYSFNKCFVARYKGRLHHYRDDLSQKGSRNMAAVGLAQGLFEEFKQNLN
jgi:hypothetical protein